MKIDGGKLAALIGLMALGVFGWDWPIFLPFKLLAVMGHETGHAVGSWIAGGSVVRVSIRPEEAGECLSRIPDGFINRIIVSSGGYVGAAIVSALLLLFTFRFNLRRVTLWFACAWLVAMGIFYARDLFTFGFCAVMAGLFALAAKKAPPNVLGVLNLFIAAFTSLYAAMDLKDDLWNSAVRAQSDAQILASETHVPAVVWAAVWTVLATAVLLVGAVFALRKEREPAKFTTAPAFDATRSS